MTPDVLILTECGPSMGVGHLSRSRVLAEALAARGASVRLALTTPDCLPTIERFPAGLIADATPTTDLLIIDGYRIGAETIAPFAAQARTSVLIDDMADRPRPADIIVNFMLYGAACDYDAYPATTRLLGPRYAPIRPGFAALRAADQRAAPRALLSFGGGATGLLGLDVAHALAQRFDGPIDIALGGNAGAAEASALPPNVTLHVGAQMEALMARATLYAGALGTTFLEALAAGLPCVTAVVAPDQVRAAEAARALGVPVLDPPDPEAIAEAAASALRDPRPPALPDFPDGHGANRLAEALLCADSARMGA